MRARIDLNADVGEGAGQDDELIPFVTSVNVACGGHAGDPDTMRATAALARAHGVAVGAHPSFPDRANFGRRPMDLPAVELEAAIAAQVRTLAEVAAAQLVLIRHVKPHGALYNIAAKQTTVADAIIRAVASVDSSLILVGLAGSTLIERARAAGLRTAAEAFADRAYEADGSLASRETPGSVLSDPDVVARQAVAIVRDGRVTARDGSRIAIAADTLCVHGDTPNAATLARRVRQALEASDVVLKPMSAV